MTTDDVSNRQEPVGRSKWRGPLFPAVVVLVAAVVVVLLWVVPSDELARGYQVFYTAFAALVALLLLSIWLFVLSNVSWAVRGIALGAAVAIAALFGASIRRVDLTGDLVPVIEFRWQKSPQLALLEHRSGHDTEQLKTVAALLDVQDTDMPEYRGHRRDGVVVGPRLRRNWQTELPRLVWRQPVGGGYGGFAVAGNCAITIEQRGQDEAVVCYHSATGREFWVYRYPALFSETLGGDGPRATPTIVNDRVYAQGATGVLTCLDGASGEKVWSRNVLKLFGVENLQWGMAGSPLVFEGVVVVNPGVQSGEGDKTAVVALAAATGDVRWKADSAQAGYASPMLATFAGERQILIFDAAGAAGSNPETGQQLWRYPWKSQSGINAAQPAVAGPNKLFISSVDGGALVEVAYSNDTWTATPVWENRNLKSYFANPIVLGSYIYGLDLGILVCLDVETGKRLWKGGRYGHGQILLTDDLLVILTENGELVLVEATPEAHRELCRFQVIEGRTWNNPTLVDGRIYVRNHLEMACYDLR
jgi:outer membrane protein assembly factor BamB